MPKPPHNIIKSCNLRMVFNSTRGLDAGTHIHHRRFGEAQGLGDIVSVQAAREEPGQGHRCALQQRPVKALAGAAMFGGFSIEERVIGNLAELFHAFDIAPSGDRYGLDDRQAGM